MKSKIIYLGFVVLLICFIVLGSGYVYLNQYKKSFIHVKNEREEFIIESGQTMNKVLSVLEKKGIIDNPTLIKLLIKLNPELARIRSAIYELTPDMTVNDMLELFISNRGKQAQFNIQLIEGKTANDFINELKSKQNIKHIVSNLSSDDIAKKLNLETQLEGWLSPDTYFYTEEMTDFDVIKIAHNKLKQDLDSAWKNRADDLPYKSPYEMLIMASLIEKETGINDERTKVASVFVNRLKAGMRLQTDPTIIYGLGNKYTGTITRSNLRDEHNPYNTYVIKGLPPTPIDMPSKKSLIAAANPDKTDLYYFVANGNGGHVFSKNYKDHIKAVDEYWKAKKASNK